MDDIFEDFQDYIMEHQPWSLILLGVGALVAIMLFMQTTMLVGGRFSERLKRLQMPSLLWFLGPWCIAMIACVGAGVVAKNTNAIVSGIGLGGSGYAQHVSVGMYKVVSIGAIAGLLVATLSGATAFVLSLRLLVHDRLESRKRYLPALTIMALGGVVAFSVIVVKVVLLDAGYLFLWVLFFAGTVAMTGVSNGFAALAVGADEASSARRVGDRMTVVLTSLLAVVAASVALLMIEFNLTMDMVERATPDIRLDYYNFEMVVLRNSALCYGASLLSVVMGCVLVVVAKEKTRWNRSVKIHTFASMAAMLLLLCCFVIGVVSLVTTHDLWVRGF